MISAMRALVPPSCGKTALAAGGIGNSRFATRDFSTSGATISSAGWPMGMRKNWPCSSVTCKNQLAQRLGLPPTAGHACRDVHALETKVAKQDFYAVGG